MNKKVILVTGATSKLGGPIVEALASKNWVVYAGMRDVRKSPWKSNKNIHAIKLDITSDNECKNAVRKIINVNKKIDCVINNAGVSLAGPTLDFTSDQFLETININTLGAFRISRYVVPFMKKQKSNSQIINITSLNGLISLPNFGIYSASKFALEALSIALRTELKKDNIWVTAIAPGAINTGIKLSEHGLPHKPLREKFKVLNTILKMATVEEVIEKIMWTIQSDNPPARIIIGRDAKVVFYFNRLLPIYVWDKLSSFVWSK